MLKTIIVEDETYIRESLNIMLNSFENSISIIAECDSIEQAVKHTKLYKPDLIFLDVVLKDGNAFEFLQKTSEINYKVVFITAHEEYALKAIKVMPVDYLLKPIDEFELKIAVSKIEEKLANYFLKNRIIVSLQGSYQIIEYKDLLYCKSDKGYTTFHLKDGKKIVASKPIKEFEHQLSGMSFFRTHQSYIININYIDKYDKTGYVVLKSSDKIPVSKARKDEFVTKLIKTVNMG